MGFVQATVGDVSFNIGFNSTTVAGNTLVCVICAIQDSPNVGDAPPTIHAPVTSGITWVLGNVVSATAATEGAHHYTESVAIYYAVNAPSIGPSTHTTVSVTPSGAGSVSGGQQLIEWSGLGSTVNLVTGSGTNPSQSPPANAGTLSISGAGAIFVGITNPNFNTSYTAGTGYAKISGGVGPGASAWGVVQYQALSAGGSYPTTWGPAVGQSGPWACNAVALVIPNQPVAAQCVPSLTEGIYLPEKSLYIGPATALFTNPIATSRLSSFSSLAEGRTSIVIDFDSGAGLYSRDFETTFTWPLGLHLNLDVWQPNLIPQPEGIFGRVGDWDDGGSSGAKFIQGIIVEANSFNVAKTFQLQSADDLTYHTLKECPATFNQQSTKAFSCTPFVAHSARWISFDGVEWQVFDARLVFEPFPESTLNWETEMTSLGLVGYGHVREMNIPHISTADLTLVLTFDDWPTITLTIPNSGGVQAKTKVTLPANKFKLIGFRVYSTSVFRIFAPDLELKLKYWGSTGSYEILKPFGGPSSPGALV